MKHLKTLRVRFALWVAGLLVAALVTFGGFVYFRVERGLNASVDDALELSATQATTAVNFENGLLNFSDSIPDADSGTGTLSERGLTIRVLDSKGQIVQAFGRYHALPITPENLAVARTRHATFATVIAPQELDSIRTYTAPIIENGQLVGLIQVVHNLNAVRKTLQRLLEALLVGTPLITMAGSLASYFLVARALNPVDQLTRMAHRIVDAGDLAAGARLHLPATEDEVGRLATTFDEMLGRLDDSFQRERQFTADASHELRTPVATLQAIVAVIRAERRTLEDYEQALDDIAEQADRLRSLVEDLLSLARSDIHQGSLHEPIDLSTLLLDLTDSLRPLAETKGLTLLCHMPAGLRLTGDTDALIRLFVNLVENAVKYTEAGSVSISAEATPEALTVKIADTGLGIPSEHIPHIFNRFYRVEQSRTTRGAGLGLAIAQEIARAHGGVIAVERATSKGTTFTVWLPVASACSPRSYGQHP